MTANLGLVFFPAFDWAISPTHPEREERLLYTKDQVFEEGVMDFPEIKEFKAAPASVRDVARAHFCIPDVAHRTTQAHLVSAGAGLVLAEAYCRGEIERGFSLARPPGHHAMRITHGNRGFCNINNEAIMVESLRSRHGVGRIAIVDTDVHHGDGTQDIFYNDPDVLFISFHQDGRTIFPGTGFPHEVGGPAAGGFTLNIPLPPRTTDEGIHFILDELILPVLEDFKPELIVNSAGQDNHYTDPLADMAFTAQGYARLNEKLKPQLAVLEGGYAIETALPYVNLAVILAMAGLDYSWIQEPSHPSSGVFQENPASRAGLKELVTRLRELWDKRGKIMDPSYNLEGDFFVRRRPVYYDTDGIQERQEERVKNCSNCPGYTSISSHASGSIDPDVSVLAVSIPRQACEHCRQEGLDVYQAATAKPGYHLHVYLQDKPGDTYTHYDVARKQETVY